MYLLIFHVSSKIHLIVVHRNIIDISKAMIAGYNGTANNFKKGKFKKVLS